MVAYVFFILTIRLVYSVPVIPTFDNAEESTQYKKYLEEAPKTINVDPQTLALAKQLLDRNSTLDDTLLLRNTSLRDIYDETHLRLVEKLLKAHLKSSNGNPNIMGGVIHKKVPGYETESPKKIIDQLKKLDTVEEKQYQEHVAKEKRDTVRKFKKLTEEERANMLKDLRKAAEKHRNRPKIYEPGSQDQLKEYWEKYEGLDKESFNPRTLFAEIDLDGDGYLNVNEVEAVLQRELEKVYNPEDPDYDPWEEKYDQTRMRKNFMDRFDKDGDYFVSRAEFLGTLSQPYSPYDRDWMTAQDEEDMFETNEAELRRLASEAQLEEQDRLTNEPNLDQSATGQPNVQKV